VKLPKGIYLFFSLLLAAVIFAVDYFTDVDINVFYLIPMVFMGYATKSFLYTLFSGGVSLSLLSFLQFQTKADMGHFIWEVCVNLIFYVILGALAVKFKKLWDKEKENARTDFLTGIKNKQGFYETLNAEHERFIRNGKPITVVYLDLDNFKTVNDNFGHDAGDKLLKNISRVLRENIRKYDTAARIGGDEFALLLIESEPSSIDSRLGKIRDALTKEILKIHSNVSVSIGAVTYTKHKQTYDDMIKEADIEMYLVKKNGKNGINHIIK
jgi:diguanylate cyclase (GGDEF)-like protein